MKIKVENKENNSLNSSQFKFLDVVKGLAALWIAWFHIDLLMLPRNEEIWSLRTLASLGFSGVNVFLLLSGFGLTLSMLKFYSKSNTNWKNLPWKQFFIRRFLRIYPLYIFCHILFFIMGIFVGKYSHMPLNIGFFYSITGLRVFFPQYFWYGPNAFWFIGLIIQLYLLFPFLFFLLVKLGKYKFIIITCLICIVSRLITANSEYSYDFMRGLAPNRLGEFCLGMTVAYFISIEKIPKIHIFTQKASRIIMLLVIILAGALIYFQPESLFRTACIDLVLAITSFSILALIAELCNQISYIFNSLVFLGGISYSFYLLHSPPIRPAFATFKLIGIENLWLITVIYLLIITFFSFVLTYLESVLLPLKRKF